MCNVFSKHTAKLLKCRNAQAATRQRDVSMLQLQGSWHAVVVIATMTQNKAKALAKIARVADRMFCSVFHERMV